MSNWINYFARGLAITCIGYILLISFTIIPNAPEDGNSINTLILQLTPAAILAAMLWIAWGSPIWGGLGFVFLGLLPSTILSGEDWANFLLAAPILFTGALFITVFVIEKFNEQQ